MDIWTYICPIYDDVNILIKIIFLMLIITYYISKH